MTVVTIIGILAAIALPAMAFRMRDRRTTLASEHLVMMYRTARMRAIGRGSAVLVRFDKSSGQNVTVLEAIAGVGNGYGCNLQPVSSCTVPANRWETPTLFQRVDEFNPFPNNKMYVNTEVDLYDGDQVIQPRYDVCFTPSGVTFARTNPGGPWGAPLAKIPTIQLCTKDSPSTSPCVNDVANKRGPDRYVYVLPNGVARWSAK